MYLVNIHELIPVSRAFSLHLRIHCGRERSAFHRDFFKKNIYHDFVHAQRLNDIFPNSKSQNKSPINLTIICIIGSRLILNQNKNFSFVKKNKLPKFKFLRR